jgi:hypothetical protein
MQYCTLEGHQPARQGSAPPSISCLDSTPQSLFPQTTDTVLLAPLLHHPSLELILDSFPLVDLRRRIFLLATLRLSLGLQPFNLSPQALSV